MDFNINEIMNDILNKINNGEIVYYNENQFQFDLAWKIKERYGYDIKFEVVSEKQEDETKKNYTDLVVIGDGEYIGIELKYKTKSDPNIPLLKNQAAVGNSRYDFLWDICRLERFKCGSVNQFKYDTKYQNYKYLKGYAIFLTNDLSYTKCPRKNTLAVNLSIENGIKNKGEYAWLNPTESIKKSWRKNPIKFEYDYKFHWFPNEEDLKFKCLIVEV